MTFNDFMHSLFVCLNKESYFVQQIESLFYFTVLMLGDTVCRDLCFLLLLIYIFVYM